MVITVPYKNLTHTLKCIKLQVIDSLPYIHNYVDSSINTPKQLFKHLKKQVTFKADPHGVEYLQTVQTLMNNGGFGDCDCQTILALTAFQYLNFNPCYVVLVGNNSINPSHIYTEVYDREAREIKAFDLTNPIYNMQRPYKYKQRILFKI